MIVRQCKILQVYKYITLFCAGHHSSIQTSGPVPTVIKYSPDPPQLDCKVVIKSKPHKASHRSPVVIKHSDKYPTHSPGSHSVAESDVHEPKAQEVTADPCVVSKPVKSEKGVSPESNTVATGNKECVIENEDKRRKSWGSPRSVNEPQNIQGGKPEEVF